MHNDIITQNVKLVDEKLIINDKKIESVKGIKYLVYYVSSDGTIPFKKGDSKRQLYSKKKKVANATLTDSIAFL